MAYAQLANLPVEYGLYTSFMGVLLYWFFATSKDITIGVSKSRYHGAFEANSSQPVAVLSTITGQVVTKALPLLPPQYPKGPVGSAIIASCLAIIDGAIICFLGLARLGWIVEVISLPAISAFMTGSALNIAVGQIPSMMGMAKFSAKDSGISSRDPTYLVVINILRNLNDVRIDAAMGLTALAMLYLIRSGCNWGARRMPLHKKTFFFIATLRTAFVILLYTGISAGVNLFRRSNPRFKILGEVPRGFQHAGVPVVNADVISAFASDLPAVVIVTLIEHIAIAKSFGRVNNYTIDPSQELVAIGVTNLLAPFLGAYAATGSFSRTAIKSKAGVRTPFAGVITALVVLLAIYALPPVFYYIPQSSLSAVIIHAVGDLITPPNTVYQFWRISPLEVIIFFAGVIVTVFTSIENGIYVTISVTMGIYLFRVFKARGRFLGKVKIHSVIGDHLLDDKTYPGPDRDSSPDYGTLKKRGPFAEGDPDGSVRNAFLPLSHHDGSNPQIEVEKPYPGIFIYRFSDGLSYPNANRYLDTMTHAVFEQTRRTNVNSYPRPGVSPFTPTSTNFLQKFLWLTSFAGPSLEQPGSAQGQGRRRPPGAADAEGHHPRHEQRQQRRRDVGAAADRRAQPARHVRRARAGRLALRLHRQPLGQARARERRLRLPDPASGRRRWLPPLEARLQRRRDRRQLQRRGGGGGPSPPGQRRGQGRGDRPRQRQPGAEWRQGRARGHRPDQRLRQEPRAEQAVRAVPRRRRRRRQRPRRRRARAEPPAVPRRPDERAAERHRERREAGDGGAQDRGLSSLVSWIVGSGWVGAACGYAAAGKTALLVRNGGMYVGRYLNRERC